MTHSEPRLLQVYLHGQPAGIITEVAPHRTVFAFDPAYRSDSNRPTLSFSFKSTTGMLIDDAKQYSMQLHPFFSNLLPEGALRTYLAARARVKEVHEFFLLAALGQDLPGALKIVPSDPSLFTGIEDVLRENPYELPSPAAPLRFSLAGVQLKFSATQSKDKKGGLTIPTRGIGGEWIVKLPSSQHEGVPENEFSMMVLAREVGIDVPEVRLLDTTAIEGLPEGVERLSGQAYAIRRFDRQPDGPTHTEDMAQVFSQYPADKYSRASIRRIAKFLAIETSNETVQEFIRRVTFSVLIGNGDMHLKNWSIIYPDRRTPLLSPAYDFVSTTPYIPQEKFALPFDRQAEFTEFTPAEMRLVLRKAGLPEKQSLRTIQETIDRFMTVWPAQKTSLPLYTNVIQSIDQHLTTLPATKSPFR